MKAVWEEREPGDQTREGRSGKGRARARDPFPAKAAQGLGNKEFGFEKRKEDLRVGHGASESEREGRGSVSCWAGSAPLVQPWKSENAGPVLAFVSPTWLAQRPSRNPRISNPRKKETTGMVPLKMKKVPAPLLQRGGAWGVLLLGKGAGSQI